MFYVSYFSDVHFSGVVKTQNEDVTMHSITAAVFAPEAAQQWLPNVTRSLSVLVVEDEPVIGFELASILHDLGADAVGPVASIPTALSAVFNVHIDGALISRAT